MSKASPFPTVQLADVVDVLNALRIPINSAERMRRAGAVPYYGANGLQGWIDRPLFNEPLILLAEDGGNFDDFATRPIAYRIDGPAWVNNHAHIIRAKAGVNQSFIFWSIVNKDIRKYIAGGTRTKLTQGELRCIEINLPAEAEQKGIAEVLDTLDTVIHETEAIIAKLKAVKQGLLHDLLTRGIDANGELRPPQTEAPHLYKPSPLGWIPKEWEEISLGDIARRSGGHLQTGPFGSQLHANEYTVEGIPVVMPQDMIDGEVSVEHIARITERRASALARHRLKPNDVVFSRRGDLSRCVAIDERQAGWVCGTGCLLARLPTSEVNAYWLALVYQQPFTQSQVMGRAVGSTMANLNTSILGAISIARPTVTEQNEIAKRIASTSMRIRTEERTLQKLRLEKAGLMNDLLTGRVRVTPLLTTPQGSS